MALVAVGGYGRGELHPCSDVDILILVPARNAVDRSPNARRSKASSPSCGTSASRSGTACARPPSAPRRRAADVSVMTTLMEARLLVGDESLVFAMRAALAPGPRCGPRTGFLRGQAGRTARHHRYHDTAYNLEPNVKNGPGGLGTSRPSAGWRSATSAPTRLDELVQTTGFLTPAELRKLKPAQSFLWKVRFGLHVLTGRHEDRLLFDHQIKLARCSATRTPPTRWRSSSSCSATTARSWTSAG
jgi:[protein-PII] uridylyltransferase